MLSYDVLHPDVTVERRWLTRHPLLEHLVTAGYLGRKTGRGFRNYS